MSLIDLLPRLVREYGARIDQQDGYQYVRTAEEAEALIRTGFARRHPFAVALVDAAQHRLLQAAEDTPCRHRGAVAVDSAVTGETVAWLCPTCDAQLDGPPPSCPHTGVVALPVLGVRARRGMCVCCGQPMTQTDDGTWEETP